MAGACEGPTGHARPAPAPDADAPRCPQCLYLLIGLTTSKCPECGLDLCDPLESYRPSRRSPWTWKSPHWLLGGLWWSLRYPVRSAALVDQPGAISWTRSIIFALIISLLGVLAYPVAREVCLLFSGSSLGQILQGNLRQPVTTFLRHFGLVSWHLWVWAAWSLARWWLLFGCLALLWMRVTGPTSLQRLLLFAPWMVALNLMILIATAITLPDVVPEPSTLFVGREDIWREAFREVWLKRGAVPLVIVGLVFSRMVVQLRWLAAVMAAIGTAAAGLVLSVYWTRFYLDFRVIDLAY